MNHPQTPAEVAALIAQGQAAVQPQGLKTHVHTLIALIAAPLIAQEYGAALAADMQRQAREADIGGEPEAGPLKVEFGRPLEIAFGVVKKIVEGVK